MLMLETCRG